MNSSRNSGAESAHSSQIRHWHGRSEQSGVPAPLCPSSLAPPIASPSRSPVPPRAYALQGDTAKSRAAYQCFNDANANGSLDFIPKRSPARSREKAIALTIPIPRPTTVMTKPRPTTSRRTSRRLAPTVELRGSQFRECVAKRAARERHRCRSRPATESVSQEPPTAFSDTNP